MPASNTGGDLRPTNARGWHRFLNGGTQSREVASNRSGWQNDGMKNRRQIIDDRLYAHFVTFGVFRCR